MDAKWQITITNGKTLNSKTFFCSDEYPRIDKLLEQMDKDCPTKHKPELWEVSVYALLGAVSA